MIAVTRGVGPESLNARCSNEDGAGRGMRLVLMSFRCSDAIPPPRPSGRGLSRYVYPLGVVWLSEK